MARKKQEVMVVFPDLFVGTKRLTDAQFGMLMRALYAYRYENTEYSGEDVSVAMAFDFAKPQIDRYVEVCNTNRKNRNGVNDNEVQRNATEFQETQGNAPQIKTQNQTQTQNQVQNENQSHTQNENHNQDHIHPPLSPPSDAGDMGEGVGETYEEDTNSQQYPSFMGFLRYCREHGLNEIDQNGFYFHCLTNGWKDREGDPIKDWKALARSWNEHRRDEPFP